MFSGQSLAGREANYKKNGEHVTKLADSLLGWRLGLAESSPCVFECQAEPTVVSVGTKLGESTTVNFDGDEQAVRYRLLEDWSLQLQLEASLILR